MYTYIKAYKLIHVYICIYICTYICISVCTYICVSASRYVYVCIHMYVYVYVYKEKSPISFGEDWDALDDLVCVYIKKESYVSRKEPHISNCTCMYMCMYIQKRALHLSGRIWMHMMIFRV